MKSGKEDPGGGSFPFLGGLPPFLGPRGVAEHREVPVFKGRPGAEQDQKCHIGVTV